MLLQKLPLPPCTRLNLRIASYVDVMKEHVDIPQRHRRVLSGSLAGSRPALYATASVGTRSSPAIPPQLLSGLARFLCTMLPAAPQGPHIAAARKQALLLHLRGVSQYWLRVHKNTEAGFNDALSKLRTAYKLAGRAAAIV